MIRSPINIDDHQRFRALIFKPAGLASPRPLFRERLVAWWAGMPHRRKLSRILTLKSVQILLEWLLPAVSS